MLYLKLKTKLNNFVKVMRRAKFALFRISVLEEKFKLFELHRILLLNLAGLSIRNHRRTNICGRILILGHGQLLIQGYASCDADKVFFRKIRHFQGLLRNNFRSTLLPQVWQLILLNLGHVVLEQILCFRR
jgi:hypothetical protein